MRTIATPTRIVLLNLKKRLELARRGHKLLKDKLDGLVSRFLEISRMTEEKLGKLGKTLPDRVSDLMIASSGIDCRELDAMSRFPAQSTSITVEKKNIMGVRTPIYSMKTEGSPLSYSFAQTTAELDTSIMGFGRLLPDLAELAGLMKSLELIAREIIKVKRRVNALEHILIPELSSQVAFIRMKLSEMERSYLTSLMKIKDIVREKGIDV